MSFLPASTIFSVFFLLFIFGSHSSLVRWWTLSQGTQFNSHQDLYESLVAIIIWTLHKKHFSFCSSVQLFSCCGLFFSAVFNNRSLLSFHIVSICNFFLLFSTSECVVWCLILCYVSLNSKVSQRPTICSQKPNQKVRHRPSSVKTLMPLSEALILSLANVHTLEQVYQLHISKTAVMVVVVVIATVIVVLLLYISKLSQKFCHWTL